MDAQPGGLALQSFHVGRIQERLVDATPEQGCMLDG
jgi:hypothetical protein